MGIRKGTKSLMDLGSLEQAIAEVNKKQLDSRQQLDQALQQTNQAIGESHVPLEKLTQDITDLRETPLRHSNQWMMQLSDQLMGDKSQGLAKQYKEPTSPEDRMKELAALDGVDFDKRNAFTQSNLHNTTANQNAVNSDQSLINTMIQKDMGDGLRRDANREKQDQDYRTKFLHEKETERLIKLGELDASLTSYKKLLNQYGSGALTGTKKALLDAAYKDLFVKAKEADDLGALTGPDLKLEEGKFADPTGLGAYMSSVTGHRTTKDMEDAVEQYRKSLKGAAQGKLGRLKMAYPHASVQDLYNEVAKPFGGTSTDSGDIEVVSPDGQVGTIPVSQWEEAQAAGYRRK